MYSVFLCVPWCFPTTLTYTTWVIGHRLKKKTHQKTTPPPRRSPKLFNVKRQESLHHLRRMRKYLKIGFENIVIFLSKNHQYMLHGIKKK